MDRSILYLSVGKYCPCKMRVLDHLFDNIICPFDENEGKTEEKSVILDIRIMDRVDSKNVQLMPLDIPESNKKVFDNLNYKRMKDMESNLNIILSMDDSITVEKVSRDLEFFISERFPSIPAKTFLNYCK